MDGSSFSLCTSSSTIFTKSPFLMLFSCKTSCPSLCYIQHFQWKGRPLLSIKQHSLKHQLSVCSCQFFHVQRPSSKIFPSRNTWVFQSVGSVMYLLVDRLGKDRARKFLLTKSEKLIKQNNQESVVER